MDLMCGSFQLERSENLEEYYRVIGVPYFVRLMLCASKPSLYISKEGETWSLKTSTLFRTSELRFKLGESYLDKMPSGVELENVTEIDGNTMITKSKVQNGQEFERVYDFSEAEMIMDTVKVDLEQMSFQSLNKHAGSLRRILCIFTQYVFAAKSALNTKAYTLKHNSGVEAKRYFKRVE